VALLVHGWFALIGISVLTTYQHHFIDLPTGALAGWLCVWLWPVDQPSPLLHARPAKDPKRWRLGLRYAMGALVLTIVAFTGGGAWLWLLWPAVAVLLVALNYWLLGAAGFQKRADGRLSPAARWLYAPYLAAAWLNSRLWTRKHPQPDRVVDNVWLGRIPTPAQLSSFNAVVDLCAELPVYPQGRAYHALPVPRPDRTHTGTVPGGGPSHRALARARPVAGVLCPRLFPQRQRRGRLAAAQWTGGHGGRGTGYYSYSTIGCGPACRSPPSLGSTALCPLICNSR
jgi:hypothetical protein